MNIVSTQFTLQHNSFEIYLSGCSGSPRCKGCHNPELWDFNIGDNYLNILPNIIDKINSFDKLVKNVWILGGEPLDNNHKELFDLLIKLQTLNLPIWLFTRYELREVPKEISDLCNFIKTGRYEEDLKSDDNIYFGIKLASNNQKILKNNK